MLSALPLYTATTVTVPTTAISFSFHLTGLHFTPQNGTFGVGLLRREAQQFSDASIPVANTANRPTEIITSCCSNGSDSPHRR